MEMIEKQFRSNGFKSDSNDISNIPLEIETRLNRTAIEIFRLYAHSLMRVPNNYVISAIWGIKEKGELDPEQKEIFKLVTPLIDEIFEILHLCKLSQMHIFSIEYMVRELVVMKIAYMIECYNSRKHLKNGDDGHLQGKASYCLESVEPIGRA